MPPRDRRSISYDQFAKPKRRWGRLMAWIGVPAVLVAGAAVAGYVALHRHEPLDTSPPPALAKASGPVEGETYRWSPVAIGGGGFITGLSMDPAGKTFVVRTDVYGAYIWNAKDNRWYQLVTSASMPERDRVQDGIASGAYEVVVAPSRPDRIYLAIKGSVYRSDDRGAHFVAAQSGPFPLAWDANSEWRLAGPFMAVDPVNPDVVLLGTPANGVWRSADAGASWQQVTGVPVNKDPRPDPGVQAPGAQIWFEPGRAGKPGGRVFVSAAGHGLYVSSDHGATFTPLTHDGERPTTVGRGTFGRDGAFFAVDEETKSIWVYRGSRWANVTRDADLTSSDYVAIAADPHSGRVLALDKGGKGNLSLDDGKTWTSVSHAASVGPGDPPWLKVADLSYFTTGDIMFDPVKRDRIWVAHGVGVFYADLSGEDTHLAWVSQARGIEELVANDVVQAPGHAPLFAGWDFGIHVKHDLNAFSTRFVPDRYFIAVQQVDWTPADPDFLVTNASDTRTDCCSQDGNAVMAGYSTDGGNSWTKFANLPVPPGTRQDDPWRMSFGTIAVSSGDPNNIVWAPAHNRTPFFTKDRGKSWEPVVLPGAVGDSSGSFRNPWYQRKTLTADKTTGGVFYLVHSGEAPNATLAGLWRTRDGGASWEQAFIGEIAPNSGMAAKLRSVPGQAGHLFFTTGVAEGDTRLRRSTDGGSTWSVLGDVTRVDDIAFGKAAAGARYPTIYLSGQVGGVYGVWRSIDAARSWQQLAGFPVGTLDRVTVVGADPDVFGRVYLGYMGSGWIWGEPAPCSPAPYKPFATTQCSAVGR